ncbi:HoxN/HupN/NixA family nickel/cobalt transporter [Thermogemmatispora tikiterensis]|uniref:Nickel/cobalt efflux system n=1 Tax=Thermogemmatispora tikiterensis TaxID=1825093 RepID=A0A328VDP0_9CHLR|nr:HoxN/HupN/NixA family nickel/cobalt transporter [Thermogemmatispora tikiterensis]RAQ94102.1 nickel transporter [Thermogemmatispora tikiterensis]
MSSNFGISALRRVYLQSSSEVRRRVLVIYALLIGYNILAWALTLLVFAGRPDLVALALTAYTFGLRHAFDADHISAIDNVTRKLMQEKQRPVGVGLFFSLGHSTIVVILTVLIALAAVAAGSFTQLKNIGGLVGTAVSAFFLLLVAAINLVILGDIYRTFQTVKKGGEFQDVALDESLNKRGLLGRFFRPLLKMTDRSWKMYPIGLLFGLGFDTATEIGLLGIAAFSAGHGVPVMAILLFPALFTAGMTLMDTTDSVLMLGAYGWAFVKPIRKLYYNFTITLISVLVALVIGSIEALSILASELNLSGPFWDQINGLSDQFGLLGVIIVCLFVVSWAISTIVYRIKRYDEIEVHVTRPATSTDPSPSGSSSQSS